MKIPSRVLSAAVGLALVCGLALVGIVPAQAVTAGSKASFVASLVTPAQQSQRKFGVPASVSIAQAIINSDWGTSGQAKSANNYFNTPCSAAMTATQFAKLAEAQVGKPYVLGAEAAITTADPAKFDCSELVEWLFGRSGNPITDLAAAQYNVTKPVAKGDSPKPGDLVFLRNNPARSNGIGHVAVLTKKLDSGEWEIVEARGRAYGVVKSTLSYWKQRSYYAGLRRYAKLVFADADGVAASAASAYQAGCTTLSGNRYAKFSSTANSFHGHAAAVVEDSQYQAAREVINSIPGYVDAIARIEHPDDAAAYAKSINELIAEYQLTDYDVVPFDLVLLAGSKGTKVTALQYLLRAAGLSVKTTGTYDSRTVSAVKSFQVAKKLDKDGEAGPLTLASLFTSIGSGATGDRVIALQTLLAAFGQPTDPGGTFGKDTLASIKAFQATAGRSATGIADANTWALLFMTPDQAPAPVVKGTATFTQTLSATTAKWTPGTFTLSYQWYRAGSAISGATASTYALQPADVGTSLTVAVTGTRPGYTTVSRFAAATAPVAAAKLGAPPVPKVTGKAVVGQPLTAAVGAWSPAPVELSHQWYRGATAISGATAATYVLQAADLGAKVSVGVTGSKPGYGSVSARSAASARVASGKLIATPVPKISGTPVVGGTLTADAGAWAPDPVNLAYQWYRGKTAIKGATAATYLLTTADAKANLTVKVTGAKAGYGTVARTSEATPTVTLPNQVTAGKPTLSGTAKVGKTLSVSPGTWGPEPVKLSYRWYRGSKKIAGATASSYKLKKADKGRTITIKVTGTLAGAESASAKAKVKVK